MSIRYILLRNTEKGMYMHILVYIEPKKGKRVNGIEKIFEDIRKPQFSLSAKRI